MNDRELALFICVFVAFWTGVGFGLDWRGRVK
jgi:hypothetical protein